MKDTPRWAARQAHDDGPAYHSRLPLNGVCRHGVMRKDMSKWNSTPVCAGILAFFVAGGPVSAATFYAAPGAKGGACTAKEPCTIAKCVAKVHPGDTCEAMPGTYKPYR